MKVNFGCGRNHLPGWQNHDIEVDISKPLPYADGSVDLVFTEHCVEHIDYYAAIKFFQEVRRILNREGTFRVTVPSVEQIMKRASPEYIKLTLRYQKENSVRGALHNILFCHGHKAAWTDSLMEASLYYAGFKNIRKREPGKSDDPDLNGIEGHHLVIGVAANNIESISWEAEPDK